MDTLPIASAPPPAAQENSGPRSWTLLALLLGWMLALVFLEWLIWGDIRLLQLAQKLLHLPFVSFRVKLLRWLTAPLFS